MKRSQILLPSLREVSSDVESKSHQLMLRAGLIRQLAAGLYTWLPIGLRILHKVEAIVREEMNKAGAQEVLMPAIQPAELWQESGRWEHYGAELLRLTDRHQRDFCFGPTHEEIITDLIRREIKSYKQLPANFYQIQTKFRDEIRPRFGIMRAREFLMKDAYSFHLSQESLVATYEQMYASYQRIFDRLGLQYKIVVADSGNIGGSCSHEFHVLAAAGEDQIAYCPDSNYATNLELAECPLPDPLPQAPQAAINKVSTPNQHTIEEVAKFLNVAPSQCLKTLIVIGEDTPLVALVLRGDHDLNAIKSAKLEAVKQPLQFADPKEISTIIGCDIGSIGTVDLNIPIIVDHSAAICHNFVCGANENDYHLTGVNWGRDCTISTAADIRNAIAGEQAADGSGTLSIACGIEVGHIFQLGTKYSDAMKVQCVDETGALKTLTMGCYGIGISRIVAAAIEQSHDEQGIIWSPSLSPFQVILIPINMHKSAPLKQAVETLYQQLLDDDIDVLLDDRQERPGIMFNDAELLGIPHRLVYSEKGLTQSVLEYKSRTNSELQQIPLAEVITHIKQVL